jgi:voltage-gated potassium channel
MRLGVGVYRLWGGTLSAFRVAHIRVLMSLTLALVLTATVFYHLVEGWRWLDAGYFSVVTIATVGFGDLSPKTDLGKIFTIAYILAGIGVFVALATALAEHVIRRASLRDQQRDQERPHLRRHDKE